MLDDQTRAAVDFLDITPDPKVLIALTHTPLKPLDALCEIIDNGIDSFRAAKIAGEKIRHPLLEILVPGEAQARRGEGFVRIVDNGIGLDREGLSNTLKAGFSGKNKYDTLGLFGMGFNIATGKIGRVTTVITARRQDDFALRVVLDLPRLVAKKKFEVPVEQIDKPHNFEQGTIVEVTSWWPEGHPNYGFIAQLAHIPNAQLRGQIGRRYATLLRSGEEDRVRINLNHEFVDGFEHCVWSSDRFLERQGWGLIPARIELDEVISSQKRCIQDGSILDAVTNTCVECGESQFRTVDERVRGWVGIQRFDDNNKFGIDLIRNGRAIRVSEKDAFFSFVDDLGEATKEYPTDQQTGRIIGELHLDHVPVDFQKQDFQRSSEEWIRSISFLRGGSLLPSNWKEGRRNETVVSRLFQGYRKIRNYGRADMYMGRFDEVGRKAVRIAREVEVDLYRRFQNREPGYYDDAKWWELVESANIPPVLAMEECDVCGFQNRPDDDTCGDCGRLIHSKHCISCNIAIARSATVCQDCGSSQIPEVKEPWACAVCGDTNDVEAEECSRCGALRGAEDPIAVEVLRRDGEALPELSFENRPFVMADLRRTEPLDVKVFRVGTLRPVFDGAAMPSLSVRAPGRIEIFIDLNHPSFTQMRVHPEETVAVEAAQYLYNLRTDLIGRPAHSVGNIAAQILSDVWGEKLASGPQKISENIRSLFTRIAERLEFNEEAADFFGDLDQFEQRELADRLISIGLLEQLTNLRVDGRYLLHCGPGVLAKFFLRKPDSWFGSVWNDHLPDPAVVGEAAAESAREQLVGIYSRCMEDCAAYLRFKYADPIIMSRASASREYLETHLL